MDSLLSIDSVREEDYREQELAMKTTLRFSFPSLPCLILIMLCVCTVGYGQKVIATLDEGEGPVGVTLTPDGSQVYVGNISDGTVSVIDVARSMVIDTIPTDDGAIWIAF